jgi:cell division protein ZapA (FtsZ GTPase activity inhibitor)
MANDLHLDILGTSFTITADEDEAYLQEVLSQYRAAIQNTQSISMLNEPLNVAVLTGFLLCDEINKMKLQLEDDSADKKKSEDKKSADKKLSEELEKRTMNLIEKLDQALRISGGNG